MDKVESPFQFVTMIENGTTVGYKLVQYKTVKQAIICPKLGCLCDGVSKSINPEPYLVGHCNDIGCCKLI